MSLRLFVRKNLLRLIPTVTQWIVNRGSEQKNKEKKVQRIRTKVRRKGGKESERTVAKYCCEAVYRRQMLRNYMDTKKNIKLHVDIFLFALLLLYPKCARLSTHTVCLRL